MGRMIAKHINSTIIQDTYGDGECCYDRNIKTKIDPSQKCITVRDPFLIERFVRDLEDSITWYDYTCRGNVRRMSVAQRRKRDDLLEKLNDLVYVDSHARNRKIAITELRILCTIEKKDDDTEAHLIDKP